jgi:hypothetical protein
MCLNGLIISREMSNAISDPELLLLIQERLTKLELEAAVIEENEEEDEFDEDYDDDDEEYDSDEDDDDARPKSKYSQLGSELAALDRMQSRERERQLVRSYMGQEFAIIDERKAQDRARNTQLVRSYQIEGVGSKALPAQYHFKEAPAFDLRMAQNRHHTGSHYVMAGNNNYFAFHITPHIIIMAGSKQFQRGVRVKGVVSRHSKQAALRNGIALSSKGKISKKARLRRKQSLARSEI